MKLRTFIFVILLNLLGLQFVIGQDYEFDEQNWLGEFGYSEQNPLRHSYYKNRYSKDDVIKAREKLVAIRNSNFNDEWEGFYRSWGELNQFGLIWNSSAGYIDYDIYTCAIELRGLGFGNATNSADFVNFSYEKPRYSAVPKSKIKKSESIYIKVKIGEGNYLVPQDQLKDFCEFAVGRKEGTVLWESLSYWSKSSNDKKEKKGIPILPTKYKHLVVFPVDAKIVKLGKTIIKPSKDREDKTEYGGVLHYVTISAGKDQNIEKKMDIYIPELDETARVEQVFSKTSTAIITRNYYKTKVERCWDKDHEIIACPEIKVGMSAITKSPFE